MSPWTILSLPGAASDSSCEVGVKTEKRFRNNAASDVTDVVPTLRHSNPSVLLLLGGFLLVVQFTFSPGRKRVSFSTTSRSAAPALRIERVIPPGPGPTSHTYASFKLPA